MIPLAIEAQILQGVIAFFVGGSFASVVGYIFLRPKTKAEAAAKRAEGDHVDVGSQAEIIESWRKHSKDLEDRLARTEARLDESDRREHDITLLLFQMSLWQQKAYLLMTEEQRTQAGQPPKINNELFTQRKIT